MGSFRLGCPRPSLVSLCAVKFYYKALFPKGNKTKTFIIVEHFIRAANTAANCPPAGLWVTALTKEAMARGWGWEGSAMRVVHTCAYRLNITWRESSWKMKWKGKGKGGKKSGGEESEAKHWSRQCRRVGRGGGGEGKKQVWSGKLVQISGQNSPKQNQRPPRKKTGDTRQ